MCRGVSECSMSVEVYMSVYMSECGVSVWVGVCALAINGNKGGEDRAVKRRCC